MTKPGYKYKSVSLRETVYDELVAIATKLQAQLGTPISVADVINIMKTEYLKGVHHESAKTT